MVCIGKFLLDTRIDMGSIYSVQQVSNCWTKDVPVFIHNPPPPPHPGFTVHQHPSKKYLGVSRYSWLLQRKNVKSPIQKTCLPQVVIPGGVLDQDQGMGELLRVSNFNHVQNKKIPKYIPSLGQDSQFYLKPYAVQQHIPSWAIQGSAPPGGYMDIKRMSPERARDHYKFLLFNKCCRSCSTNIEKCGRAALKHGIRNPETETESRKWKRKRNTESNINDRKF